MKDLCRKMAFCAAVLGFACGCSDRDPVTRTPVYHNGTPTNRSSVQSWELNREPFYTQPGVNSGAPVSIPASIPSQRRFEPYDPLAERVYASIGAAHVDVKYITVTAKNGSIVLVGSMDNRSDLAKALDIAAHVPGVKHIKNELTAAAP